MLFLSGCFPLLDEDRCVDGTVEACRELGKNKSLTFWESMVSLELIFAHSRFGRRQREADHFFSIWLEIDILDFGSKIKSGCFLEVRD